MIYIDSNTRVFIYRARGFQSDFWTSALFDTLINTRVHTLVNIISMVRVPLVIEIWIAFRPQISLWRNCFNVANFNHENC